MEKRKDTPIIKVLKKQLLECDLVGPMSLYIIIKCPTNIMTNTQNFITNMNLYTLKVHTH